MPQPPLTQHNGAVLGEKIDRLMDAFAKLECSVTEHIELERRNREQYLVDHAKVEQTAQAAHSRLDRLEPVVEELRRAVQTNERQTATMNQRLGLIVAILSPIGLAVLYWLIQQILTLVK